MTQDVLIVEDDPVIVEYAVSFLARAGLGLRCAGSGEAALALARERWPGAVLLDLTLPDADGWVVWDRLRALAGRRPLHVVLFTADFSETVRRKAGARDVFAVVQKPALPGDLVNPLKRALAASVEQAA